MKTKFDVINSYFNYPSGISNILRNPKKIKEKNELLENLELECSKLIPYSGDVLFRIDFQNDSKIAFSFFKKNLKKVICFPSILSCYRSINEFPINVDELEIYLEIHLCNQTNAIDTLRKLKPVYTEKEVFFKPNSCFEIISIEGNCVKLQESKKIHNIKLNNNVGPYEQKITINKLRLDI